jgi:arylsulfatase A-like enzyme
MTYYPGVDEIGHRLGTDSSEYGDALVDFDNSVGRITRAIEAMGLAKTTRYAMIADHGMVPIRPGQNFEFIRWLARGRGLKVLNRPLEDSGYAARYEAIQAYDAVASVDAGRVAMIHLRGRNGWARRPDGEEARAWATAAPAIHDLEAVEMVAARAGADRASVWSRHGSVTIERRVESGRRLYRVAEASGDPLALRGSPALEEFARAGWHDSRDWLAASAGSRYPDLVPQVIEMFDSSHTGDLVVFAAEGWLLYPNEKAGHGSTLFRDMHVPMFFAGPGLPGGTQIPAGRLMDLVPTLLGLLGQADRLASFPPVDGIDLSEALRRAAPRDAALPAPTPARRLPAS